MIELLNLAAIPFPEIDPIIFSIGPLAIRWYALAYIVGMVLGWRWILRLNTNAGEPIKKEKLPHYISSKAGRNQPLSTHPRKWPLLGLHYMLLTWMSCVGLISPPGNHEPRFLLRSFMLNP